ncbi:MAG TPA: hypothetical protein VJO15_03740, partial [Dehalococcoidia bacterium]|nr:hypothetical protein [Dehalococcoidia bacterium]
MISKPANATKRAPNNAEWYDSSLTDLLEEQSTASANPALDLAAYVPKEIGPIGADHQTALPRIAGNARLTCLIDEALRQVPTQHSLYLRDARRMDLLKPETVHLVVC